MGEFLDRLHRVAVDRWLLVAVYLVWGFNALELAMAPFAPWWLWVPINLAAGVMGLTIAAMFAFRGMPR